MASRSVSPDEQPRSNQYKSNAITIGALARTYVLSEGRINAMNAAINKRSASSILTLINGEFNGNLSNFSNA